MRIAFLFLLLPTVARPLTKVDDQGRTLPPFPTGGVSSRRADGGKGEGRSVVERSYCEGCCCSGGCWTVDVVAFLAVGIKLIN